MSLPALLAAKTPVPPAPPAFVSGAIRDAVLPDLPIDHTFTVTPGTVAGLDAAIQSYRATQTGPLRDRLIEVLVEPGFYTTSPIANSFAITRGVTGDPADVIIAPPGEQGGVLHYYVGPTWMRGLTLRSTTQSGNFGAKYPLHISGPGSLTLVDCNLEALNAGSDGGPAIVGMDGFDGAYVTFVGCNFSNLGGYAANMHGATETLVKGRVIAYYDCHIVSEGTPHEMGFFGSGDGYYIGGDVLPGAGGGFVTHTSDWPAPVGGFANYERIQYGIT